MNPDDLLDFSLDLLEGPHRAAAEAAIARDPALGDRADRLGRALRNLLDDGDGPEPPAGLASRTVAFVADRKSRRAILDFVPARVPFGWPDVAVAAGVLIAGILTFAPAVKSAREKMSQAGCGFNLQQLYAGLTGYAIRHGHYPSVVAPGSDTPVGSYALKLDDEDLLGDCRSLHCPCRGPCPADGPRPDPRQIDYAYHVGFLNRDSGQTIPASPRLGSRIPVLADQPPHDNSGTILEGNSPNHGGRGQNVLFSDGSIHWMSGRRLGVIDSDIFLNEARLPEPGLWPNDSTLAPAGFPLPPR